MDNNSLYNLVQAIISYYRFTKQDEDDWDSSEDWKRKAGLTKPPVPLKIDRLAEKVFLQRLAEFQKPEDNTQDESDLTEEELELIKAMEESEEEENDE